MNGRFADVLFEARQRAGYTRERAAEMLNISPRTLTYYEAGRQVPDRIVAMMVDAYTAPEAGYYWLSNELYTGRILLPKVNVLGVSNGALQMRVSLRNALQAQERLEDICRDDVIAEDEETPLSACINSLRELAAACMGMEILGTKKSALAGTKADSTRKTF